jgi:hypothetical protein
LIDNPPSGEFDLARPKAIHRYIHTKGPPAQKAYSDSAASTCSA